MYILFHLKAPDDNFIAFTVTCANDYKVEYGTISGNTFISFGSDLVSSNTRYENNFLYDEWADETSNGNRQVMLKITGTDLKTFTPEYHSDRNFSTFYSWNIVEIKANLPSCTQCSMGSVTSSQYSALQYLRYFSLEGTNNIVTGSYMFRNCRSLLAVLELDTSNMTATSYMFTYAQIITLPKTCDFSKVTNTSYMFQYCTAIVDLSWCVFSNVTIASYMFANCSALRYPPLFLANKLTTISYMFYSASAVEYIILYCATVTTAISPFGTNYNLSKVLLFSTGTTFPAALTFQYSLLNDTGADLLVDSVPTITVSRVITVSGTPFAASANYNTIEAKFNAKGWTLA